MIEIGRFAGFCGGVFNSVKNTEKELKNYDKLYCLGELVHNRQVVSSLEEKGLITIEDLDKLEDGSNVIIRAHGVSKKIYEKAKNKNINLIDLTCPKVLKIHEQVKEYRDKNYFIILIGTKTHPEVIGTISFCGENSIVVENTEELDEIIEVINNNSFKEIVVFAQTTFKESLFKEMVDYLKNNIKKNIIVEKTICDATHLRQEECKKMTKEKDCMIIIGGRNSSNTKKLYEVSSEYCKNTYIIETVEDLNIEEVSKFNNIGIMAGASTPKESIEDVKEMLENI